MKSVVSSKGQITLPVEVRDKLGLEAGTAVRFELCEGGVVIRKGRPGAHPVDQMFGALTLDRSVDALLDEMRGPRPAPAPRRGAASAAGAGDDRRRFLRSARRARSRPALRRRVTGGPADCLRCGSADRL